MPIPTHAACFIGLTLAHTRGHMVRAVLEGVSYAMRDSLAIIEQLGVPVRQIRASGGGIRRARCGGRFRPTCSGKRWRRSMPRRGRPTAWRLLAAVGAGAFKNIEEACRATIRVVKETPPNRSSQKVSRRGISHLPGTVSLAKKRFQADLGIGKRLE